MNKKKILGNYMPQPYRKKDWKGLEFKVTFRGLRRFFRYLVGNEVKFRFRAKRLDKPSNEFSRYSIYEMLPGRTEFSYMTQLDHHIKNENDMTIDLPLKGKILDSEGDVKYHLIKDNNKNDGTPLVTAKIINPDTRIERIILIFLGAVLTLIIGLIILRLEIISLPLPPPFTPTPTKTLVATSTFPPTPTSTLTIDQLVINNIEQFVLLVNDNQIQKAYDTLFTEDFRTRYLYPEFNKYYGNDVISIEIDIVVDPYIFEPQKKSETIVHIIIYEKILTINETWKICHHLENNEWLINNLFSDKNDECPNPKGE